MATGKKSSGADAAKKGVKWISGKLFRKSFSIILLILLGGLLFNLDRICSGKVSLNRFKEYLPSFVTRFLPEKNIPEGKAVPQDILEGTVISVYDGDTMTLTAEKNGKTEKFKVRFFGIDAPEAAQEYGIESRDSLRNMILDKKVKVNVVSVDRYGRSVGKVYCRFI